MISVDVVRISKRHSGSHLVLITTIVNRHQAGPLIHSLIKSLDIDQKDQGGPAGRVPIGTGWDPSGELKDAVIPLLN